MKRSAIACALAAPLLAAVDSTSAVLRERTEPVVAAALPESLTIAGPYRVTIRRRVADSAMRRALEIAERTDPPRDSVLAAASAALFKLRDPPDGERLWWSSQFDGVRVAFAITDAAVEYYLALSDTLRRGQTPAGRGVRMLESNFEYVATVERRDRYVHRGVTHVDVFVVRLRLTWSNYCGPLCAMMFDAERTVIVDRRGSVRAIEGDGPRDLTVS